MLTVTAVNCCRICAYLHTKSALTSGVGEAEIRALLDGDVRNCPAEELPGMLYAQHWAETEGHPDAEARRHLIESYGEARATDIDILLRVIKTGNYWHNTLEAIVHTASFGRWGIGECDR